MRYAIPLVGGKLSMHFGHCQEFALVDTNDSAVTGMTTVVPPAHAPGVLPAWLAEQGADVIIAGGMGSRAQNLFQQNGIDVIVGAPVEEPEALVRMHLAGALESGDNVCDH
ncbi:MAG: ATPase [Planctomycetes bacterium]|nr:ATPase [Planctomycetota bacterium]